ncbi:pleckstrin domain-containing protein [Heterostelium album PN500]|uniref:Pleckstrin domain-containing protein n=1 Tax=Heterostelium pallidum (strain ATCC 26659 / Pp 5 / PN500) TaxID=670386 RepID=D3BAS0_HETP5|nr:pleckstrin domain-containing protein [Heterostelium album PN500]EFA81657.1 pleckstrin domain-containing protein [Heterostelium album PN500]|eukprot:XP_020433774.1 pleckstrin domain-containing protein [Heterostelium album PN500]
MNELDIHDYIVTLYISSMYSSFTTHRAEIIKMKDDKDDISSGNSTDDSISDSCSLILEEDVGDTSHMTPEEIILKKERIRQQAVNEIVKTETSYIRDLKLIVKLFIEPIRGKITSNEFNDVFGCVEGILTIHRDLIGDFEGIPTKQPYLQNIGEVLFRLFSNDEFTKLYVSFCKNQTNCNNTFEKLKNNSKAFANAIEKANESHLSRGLSFSMLIIKPIQRITKYPLLLKSLVENTPHDYYDVRYIHNAYSKINFVLDEVNTQKRILDEILYDKNRLKDIENSLCFEDVKWTESRNRKVVKEGLSSKGLEKEYLRCILFNDVLILAKNKKKMANVKTIITLNRVIVRNVMEEQYGATRGFEMLLLDKKDKILKFYYNNENEKNEWFEQIYLYTNRIADPAVITEVAAGSLKGVKGLSSVGGYPFNQSSGSLREQPRRPPPPSVHDIFRRSSGSDSAVPISVDENNNFMSPPQMLSPPSLNGSSSSTISNGSQCSSGSPTPVSSTNSTPTITPSQSSTSVSSATRSNSTSNFSRAYSVPSFTSTNEEMKPNPKKMPPTISSITLTSIDVVEKELSPNNVPSGSERYRPPVPPRAPTPTTPNSGTQSPVPPQMMEQYDNLDSAFELNSKGKMAPPPPPLPSRITLQPPPFLPTPPPLCQSTPPSAFSTSYTSLAEISLLPIPPPPSISSGPSPRASPRSPRSPRSIPNIYSNNTTNISNNRLPSYPPPPLPTTASSGQFPPSYPPPPPMNTNNNFKPKAMMPTSTSNSVFKKPAPPINHPIHSNSMESLTSINSLSTSSMSAFQRPKSTNNHSAVPPTTTTTTTPIKNMTPPIMPAPPPIQATPLPSIYNKFTNINNQQQNNNNNNNNTSNNFNKNTVQQQLQQQQQQQQLSNNGMGNGRLPPPPPKSTPIPSNKPPASPGSFKLPPPPKIHSS